MATYQRIGTREQAVAAAERLESAVLDFKEDTDPTDLGELAKDMAAFANHVGGVLLVGAVELDSGHARLDGMSKRHAKTLQLAYENAARDCCLPRPLIVCEQIELHDQRVLLAINVEPVPDQLVGARFYARDRGGKLVGTDAWRFSVRIGKHNLAINPDRLAMFMDPTVRRTVIRLEGIPDNPSGGIVVLWRHPRNDFNETPTATKVFKLNVDVERNVLTVACFGAPGDGTEYLLRIPLDDVESVWESKENTWSILVRGMIHDNHSYSTNPSTARFRSGSM